MPRAHTYKVLTNPDGSVMTGASIRVLQDGTTSLIPDTLYTTDAGVEALSNPFTTSSAVIEFYLDIAQRVQLGITPPGGTEFFVTVDTEPSAAHIVTAAVADISLGTPTPGTYLRVNNSGQFEYVGAPAAAGSSVVRRFPFAFDTPGLVTGHAVYTPTIGDVLLGVWIEIETAWDGTTPLCDIGSFTSEDYGFWGNIATGPVDLTIADNVELGMLVAATSQSVDTDIYPAQWSSVPPSRRFFPAKFTTDDPIKVCVSQNGTVAGSDPGATQGQASIYLVTATPLTG